MEKVGPVTESSDDGKELSIVYLIVHFGRGEGGRVVSNSTKLFCISRVSLPEDCS